jgi:hypothetical protein
MADSLAALYGDFVDLALTPIFRESSVPYSITVGAVRTVLADVALAALFRSEHVFTLDDIRQSAERTGMTPQQQETLESLIQGEISLVSRRERGQFSFFHLSLQEWFAAQALLHLPLANVAEVDPRLLDPRLDQTVWFAMPSLHDPVPLLARTLDNRSLTHTLWLLDAIRPRAAAVAAGVAALRYALPPDITVGALPLEGAELRTPEHPTMRDQHAHERLSREWTALMLSSDTGRAKGQLLEKFMISLFGEVFAIVAHDLDTGTGELDLVLENTAEGNFWSYWGPDLVAECKHLSAEVDVAAINTFLGKVSGSRLRLFFVVSTRGFNYRARERLELAAADQRGPLLVPISGADIERMLVDSQPVEVFLKDMIRRRTNRLRFRGQSR